MKRLVKQWVREAITSISFPVLVYIYENGRIIARNLKSEQIIPKDVTSINSVWAEQRKQKLPEEVLNNGSCIFRRKNMVSHQERITADVEFTSIVAGDEHIIILLFEQSYKVPFGRRCGNWQVPRLVWRDKNENMIGCNSFFKEDAGFIGSQKSYDTVSKEDAEILEKALEQHRIILKERRSQIDSIEIVHIMDKGRRFAKISRFPLINKNDTCTGLLSIYTIMPEKEEISRFHSEFQRDNYLLNKAVSKSNRIAVTFEKGAEGKIDYVTSNIEQWGYRQEDFHAKKITWKDLVVKDDYGKFKMRNMACDLQKKEGVFCEYRIRTKGGQTIWIQEEEIVSTIKNERKYRQAVLKEIKDTRNLGNETMARLLKGAAQMENSPEFQLVFQPIIDGESGGIIASEALLRWESKERGEVSPAEFLPLSEYLGLMNPIGNFVFKEAFAVCKEWNAGKNKNFHMHINLSVIQLTQPDLLTQIMDGVRKTRVKPRNIIFEIKETLALEDIHYMKGILEDFHKEGFKVLLDDFGTGASGLNTVMELPIDYIKIDESFIRSYGTDKFKPGLLRAIVELAHSLNIKVIGSGIETMSQAEFMILSDVDFFQGYYYGRPVSKDQFGLQAAAQLPD